MKLSKSLLIFIIIVIILIIFIVRAYRKETIKKELTTPSRLNFSNYLKPNKPENIEPPPDKIPRYRKKKKTRSSKEDQCRIIFEKLFNSTFPTKRPNFLRNPETGKNLELDGYNESLQLAFEYDGEHHYNYPNTFHKTRADFDKQQERDKYKRMICDQRDITLITIPYSVPEAQLEGYIKLKLEKSGFERI